MKFLFFSGRAHLALDPAALGASGGAELQVALLARELVARGHQAVLLGAETGQKDGVVWDGITVRTGGRFDTGSPGDTVRALPRVARVLREERPDFIIVYGWTSWLDLPGWMRGRARVVFVCALDAEIDGGFRRDHPVRGWFFERGMRRASARFAITEHQARLFRERGMGCTVTRLLLQDETPRAVVDKSVDLLWVARCHPVKRPHVFLDLAESLPDSRCRMICSRQDASLWDAVRARARTLPQVEFIESVPYREIQSHFDAARIFVNTSEHEGVPNTFIHSALGGAVIASLNVDPDGMFRQFRAGFSAEGDFSRLAGGVRRLLENADECAAARSEAARFLREWHDNAGNVAAFLGGLPE